MKKILVPTDFSEQADAALSLARQIALKTEAELIALHVVEIPSNRPSLNITGDVSGVDGLDSVYVMKMIQIGRKRLKELAEREELKDVKLKVELKAGNAYYNISSIVSEYEPDMIIMGTDGSSGIEEIVIGSNTEKVVRNAKCPVLSLKTAVQLADLDNIVFATNLKHDGKDLVEKLKQIAHLSYAKIHLLKVNTPNNFESSATTTARMKEYMEKADLEAEMHIYNGINEEEGILEFAKDHDVDMIAMGTHGRKGLMHLLSGSIAEDVVNHSKRPVLTLKIED